MDFFIHAALIGLLIMFCMFCGSVLLQILWLVLILVATTIYGVSKTIVDLIKKHI